MLRTNTFYQPNLNALTSSGSIEDTPRSVTGVRRQKPHQWSGNGTHQARSGIDGMTTNGTTGDHPREDSPQSDGPGIRDSGITTDGSSNTLEDTGTDSRATSGSDMERLFQSSQLSQEVPRSVDLSTCLRSLDSQAASVLNLFQDAELDQERKLSTTCGKTDQDADSSVEDLSTKSTPSVRLENHISGLELSDALEVPFFPRRDSTTKLARDTHWFRSVLKKVASASALVLWFTDMARPGLRFLRKRTSSRRLKVSLAAPTKPSAKTHFQELARYACARNDIFEIMLKII